MGALSRAIVSGAFSVLIGLAAREAPACSIALPDPELVGSPADGAGDVPVDVVPYYSLWALGASMPIDIPVSLVSTAGDEIALTVEFGYANVFEIVPEHALEPNTEYTLSATLNTSPDGTGESIVDQVTFTTGNGPFEGTPKPPDAFLIHYRLQEELVSSCDPAGTRTCVALQPGLPVFAQSGESGNSYLYDASFFTSLSAVTQGTPDECELLRSRAPNGTLSEPLELCGADGPLYVLGGTDVECTPEGLTQDDELVTGDTAKGGAGGNFGTGGIIIVTGATGGTSTMGGTGASAGATVEEPSHLSAEPSDRTVAGCTCRAGRVSSNTSVALVALLAASMLRRRSRYSG